MPSIQSVLQDRMTVVDRQTNIHNTSTSMCGVKVCAGCIIEPSSFTALLEQTTSQQRYADNLATALSDDATQDLCVYK